MKVRWINGRECEGEFVSVDYGWGGQNRGFYALVDGRQEWGPWDGATPETQAAMEEESSRQFNERRAQEHAAHEARIAALDALAPAIVASLGDGWEWAPKSYDGERRYSIVLTHRDGAEIEIDGSANGTRYVVSGNYPTHPKQRAYDVVRHDCFPSQITMTAAKSAKAIAGDIGRRFLPQYLSARKAVLEAYAQDDARQDKREVVRRQLTRRFGIAWPANYRDERDHASMEPAGWQAARANLKLDYHGVLEITFDHVPVELAELLLDTLQQWHQGAADGKK